MNNKLIMVKGLPGSGKSTWAREMVRLGPTGRNAQGKLTEAPFKRINKDELRSMLDDGKWSKQNEKFVLETRDYLIARGLRDGWTVIVDDTNLHPKHEINLRKIAQEMEVEFEIKDFTDVPIETCIKQDLMRADSVGEAVIRKMYKDFLAPKIEHKKWDVSLPPIIICDLDGTLALFGNANPYDRDFSKDVVNTPVKMILDKFYDQNTPIFIFSGRDGKFYDISRNWLLENDIWYEQFFMRAEGDKRKDSIIKEEMYREHVEGKYNVLFVLDDRNQVVELWRRLGLTCLQVAEGGF